MSRFVAVAAAISLVISGIVVGALATYLILESPARHEGRPGMWRPPAPPPPHPPPFTREMESRLGLSDDQKKTIHAIAVAVWLLALTGVAAAVEVGQKAPDFELASTQGGKFKLSELAGKKNVVIQFYVLDFTPT